MWNEVRGLHDGIDYGTPPRDGEPVTLTVDGVEVTVPEGSSVMLAAVEADHAVPKLCATDMLEAFGSCRVCLVEIEGQRGYPASCTTLVAPGMGRTNPVRPPCGATQGCHGALSVRLPRVRGSRRLERVPSHARGNRHQRPPLRQGPESLRSARRRLEPLFLV